MSTVTTARRAAAALVAGLAALALAAAPASARPDAAAAAAKPNLVETAVAAGNFTTLVSLVKQAGLAETLSGTGPYTVFAPTDAAFKKVPKKTLTALGKDKAKLKAVLLYHVASGRLVAKRVVKRSSIKTLNGKRVQIRVRGQNVFVNRSKVVTADVRASNGIIHVINRVLIP
ncbi:MAG: fasciclin domain-containing protein [Solirubrobacteraceae bacterium]